MRNLCFAFALPQLTAIYAPLLTKLYKLCLLDKNAVCIDQNQEQTKKWHSQFCSRKGLDELEIIKNIVAKDNQFIINLSLAQGFDIPEIPLGKYNTIYMKPNYIPSR